MNKIDPYPTDRPIDATDRRILAATQTGLPLTAEPYRAVADILNLEADEVMARMRRMLDTGIIRRVGAVPNHYAVGYRANGMSVWDIPDGVVGKLGRRVGALPFVTHCYRRPRHGEIWPYNLFAMVHGLDRAEVAAKVDKIAEILEPASRGHDILYSTRILKKTGLRIKE
ncbi:MAG: Lrp/AsnC family transcriptional regulator [Rhodospirillales bacterium]|nr:Lrp/AsnC family transcriptional regulator [Rhodospirillales bacterium]